MSQLTFISLPRRGSAPAHRRVVARHARRIRLGRPVRRRPASSPPGARIGWLTRWTLRRAFVTSMVISGAAILLYPMTADWFHANAHAATVQTYARSVAQLPAPDIQAALDAAEQRNRQLPTGTVIDPFAPPPTRTPDAVADAAASAAALREYEELLNPGGDGVMGMVNISTIGVHLPIYHGTSASSLKRGAGHLSGSALPVGGAGTHTVLTGHSGIAGDPLFSDLHSLRIGDSFTIVVLNRVLTYQVDQIATVLPTELDALASVPGKDYASLITCTPIGMNSHRLLVRGVRMSDADAAQSAQTLLTHIPGGGFPFWALIAGLVVITAVLLTAPLGRSRSRRGHVRRHPGRRAPRAPQHRAGPD